MHKNFFDRTTVNIIVLSVLSLMEALQVLIITALVFSFIPIKTPVFVQKLYPLSLYDVRPEREALFYHLWIAVGLGVLALLLFLHRRRIDEDGLAKNFLPYMGVTAALVYAQIFAVFKIFLMGDPWWARDLLYAGIVLGIAARVFWPELKRWLLGAGQFLLTKTMPAKLVGVLDAGVIVLLLFLVFAPDLGKVLGRIFAYDRFYHFDSFIMAPVWGHHNGLVLNKDMNSEYSLIVPIVFHKLMSLTGEFSYARAVQIMITLSAAYYFLYYGLWRYWTKSFALSLFAILLCLKLQFFHWGVVPLVWIFPSATPLRSLWDVFLLLCILRFIQNFDLRWLLAASLFCGLGLVWTLDVGVYMFGVLAVTAAAAVYERGWKMLFPAAAILLSAYALALGILYHFYGPLIWGHLFWANTFEFASLFLQGWGALPITDGLKDKQFFAFIMGLMVPVVYLGTLLYSLGQYVFHRRRPQLFMVIICFYGLGLYHYFIHRSAVTSYYAVIVPLLFVLLFWIQALLGFFSQRGQRALKLFLCAWALGGLCTSYLFTYYPNALNLSGLDWSKEKNFYDSQFDYARDAALIDQYTQPREAVALVSSFETKILMQADRRPFFYYFPMIGSEHMNENKCGSTYLHTYARLDRTLKQLQDQRPSYVFLQNCMYQWDHTEVGLKELIGYMRDHYHYEAQGQYLTALKINP